jgi:hypothetical protein
VGCVKRNAIAGHGFASFAALEAHLAWWMREIADVRVHGATGEAPIARFRRDEERSLRPLDGRPPFRQLRELVRKVQADCAVEIDTNASSVPWRLIGVTVTVTVGAGRVVIRHAGRVVAEHGESAGDAAARAVAGPAAAAARLPGVAQGPGDERRSRGPAGHAVAAQADRHPRPARQPVGRGGAPRDDAQGGPGPPARARWRARTSGASRWR